MTPILGIILVTNYRSGSTFLGELFNQHPGSFYIFEPLFPFTGGCEVREPVKAKLLYQLLKCEFPEMLDVYTQVKGKLRRGGEDVKCLVDNFCFKQVLLTRFICNFLKMKKRFALVVTCSYCYITFSFPDHLPFISLSE